MGNVSYQKVEGNPPPSFSIKPADAGYAQVSWTFRTNYKKEASGLLSCYIPGFDIYFSATTIEDIDRKGLIIMELFMDNFFIHKKRGLNSLLIHLHRLGFQSKKDAVVLKELLHNRIVAAQFKMIEERIDTSFAGAHSINHKSEMTVAA